MDFVATIQARPIFQTGEKILSVKDHSKQINDIQTSKDGSMLITASKDTTAKVSCRQPIKPWCALRHISR